MTRITRAKRLQNLDQHIINNTLIRGKWVDGAERVCLLAALSPECGEKKDASVCPASVMPLWLAYLTPIMDDNGSEQEWSGMVKRYATIAHRWHVLSKADWKRLEFQSKLFSVTEAAQHVTNDYPEVKKVITDVQALLNRAIADDFPTKETWAASSAAASAAWAASWVASRAASSASWAASSASRVASPAAAWDRFNNNLLTAIELICTEREKNPTLQGVRKS